MISLAERRTVVETIPEATIKYWQTNLMGEWCRECGQIAFRIASIEESGKTTAVPLCGKHYIELLNRGKGRPDPPSNQWQQAS